MIAIFLVVWHEAYLPITSFRIHNVFKVEKMDLDALKRKEEEETLEIEVYLILSVRI